MQDGTGTRRLVLMGVSGSGKSRIGAMLAARLGLSFRDGDDLHPAANVAKMAAGQPLDDADRAPWLDAVGQTLRRPGTLVACSALKRVYRARIAAGAGAAVTFIHLDGSRALLAARLAARQGHFMPPALLDSQLATLEPLSPDEPGISVPIDAAPGDIVAAICARLEA